MSLQNTNREMLLSAALDGELSVHEQAEFDRALAADPTFAREYEELRSLRAEVQAAYAGLREQKLSPDFASRVTAAAYAQAESARGGRLIPSTTVTPPSTRADEGHDRASWLRVGVALALAASLLIAFGFWNRDPVALKQGQPVELNEATGDSSIGKRPDSTMGLLADTKPSLDKPQSGEPSNEELSNKEPGDDELANQEPPKVMGIKPSSELPDVEQVDAPETSDMIAAATPTNGAAASDDALATDDVKREPLSVVLVLAVELTAQGQQTSALQEALAAAEIRLNKDSVMGSEVVTHLQEASVISAADEGSDAKLYFIEASAKRIDRFMTQLMSTPDSFASVGLSLATDPPLLAAVGDLREIDPTKVRQEPNAGFAKGLVGRQGEPLRLDPEYVFVPLDRQTVESGALRAPSDFTSPSVNADDFPSQLLLLVK
jgi:hypothetical protein